MELSSESVDMAKSRVESLFDGAVSVPLEATLEISMRAPFLFSANAAVDMLDLLKVVTGSEIEQFRQRLQQLGLERGVANVAGSSSVHGVHTPPAGSPPSSLIGWQLAGLLAGGPPGLQVTALERWTDSSVLHYGLPVRGETDALLVRPLPTQWAWSIQYSGAEGITCQNVAVMLGRVWRGLVMISPPVPEDVERLSAHIPQLNAAQGLEIRLYKLHGGDES